jgi:HSP20 family protein
MLLTQKRSPFVPNFVSFIEDVMKTIPAEVPNYRPAANVQETETHFLLELNAPGFDKQQFVLSTEKNVLTIAVEAVQNAEDSTEEKSQISANYTRREFYTGPFTRSFALPEQVDTTAISARYENGILRVSLPKRTPDAEITHSISVQ